jgi:hypothetical protein
MVSRVVAQRAYRRFRANGESAGQPGRHRQIRELCVATSGTGLRWKPSILAVGALNPPWATAMERDAGRPALAWLTRQPTPGPELAVRHSGWLAVMEPQRGAGERNHPALSAHSTAIAEIRRLGSR